MIGLLFIFTFQSPASVPSTNESAATADARIVVDASPSTVRRVLFDPAHRPDEMHSMTHGEAALTQFDFECGIQVSYAFSEPPKTDSNRTVHVIARLQRVALHLTLEDTIFLPMNANIPLRSHEEGHHVIDARVYESAEAAGRFAAETAMGKTWPGEGADEDAAGKAATDAAVKAIGAEYLAATSQRASRLGDTYDDITQHGTRPINVARAIEEAFDRDGRFATSVPTSKPTR